MDVGRRQPDRNSVMSSHSHASSPVCVEHHHAGVLLVTSHRQAQLSSLLGLEGAGRGAHSLAAKRHTPRRAWEPYTDRATFKSERDVCCV